MNNCTITDAIRKKAKVYGKRQTGIVKMTATGELNTGILHTLRLSFRTYL